VGQRLAVDVGGWAGTLGHADGVMVTVMVVVVGNGATLVPGGVGTLGVGMVEFPSKSLTVISLGVTINPEPMSTWKGNCPFTMLSAILLYAAIAVIGGVVT